MGIRYFAHEMNKRYMQLKSSKMEITPAVTGIYFSSKNTRGKENRL